MSKSDCADRVAEVQRAALERDDAGAGTRKRDSAVPRDGTPRDGDGPKQKRVARGSGAAKANDTGDEKGGAASVESLNVQAMISGRGSWVQAASHANLMFNTSPFTLHLGFTTVDGEERSINLMDQPDCPARTAVIRAVTAMLASRCSTSFKQYVEKVQAVDRERSKQARLKAEGERLLSKSLDELTPAELRQRVAYREALLAEKQEENRQAQALVDLAEADRAAAAALLAAKIAADKKSLLARLLGAGGDAV